MKWIQRRYVSRIWLVRGWVVSWLCELRVLAFSIDTFAFYVVALGVCCRVESGVGILESLSFPCNFGPRDAVSKQLEYFVQVRNRQGPQKAGLQLYKYKARQPQIERSHPHTTRCTTVPTGLSTMAINPSTILCRAPSLETFLPAR